MAEVSLEMGDRLAHKTAVITGASSGIGAAVARLFDHEGASLVLADIDGRGEALATELNARFVLCDVTKSSDVATLREVSCAHFERVDILVANAGLAVGSDVEEMSEAFWERVIDVNLKSTWLTCKVFLPVMVQEHKGCIVATASQLGLVGSRGISAYGAAKAGVINLVRCIAAEFASSGIRANALCPGPTRTPGTERMLADTSDPEQAAKDICEKTLLRRLAEPNEIASAAVFLASEESSYMTGSSLVVDGGYTAI
jgi:cyclopentanol dehydrogenase